MQRALPEDHSPFDNPFPDLGKVLGPRPPGRAPPAGGREGCSYMTALEVRFML